MAWLVWLLDWLLRCLGVALLAILASSGWAIVEEYRYRRLSR